MVGTSADEVETAVRPAVPRPRRLEYRVERFPFGDTPGSPEHIEDLLDRLNELGRQGWLAVSVDLTDTAVQHPGVCHCLEPRLAVLFQRDVEEP